MFFENIKKELRGRSDVKFSITQNTHQSKILELLRNNLEEFAEIYRSIPEPDNIRSKKEDYITIQIERFLNGKIQGYLFEPESCSGPDINILFKAFELHQKPLFVIEAKRLRTQSGTDYVKGQTGGIERFKREKHGGNFEIAAMFGYLEENDFNHWHSKINGWIGQLIGAKNEEVDWLEQDKLTKINAGKLGEYQSIHSRPTKKNIKLYHFWLNLTN
ncbi:MAG: hypothetical protein ACYTFK_03485 [Planctomycetota bacterium]|jgi:hypothetical protein